MRGILRCGWSDRGTLAAATERPRRADRVDPVELGGCGVGGAGPDRAVGRRRYAECGDRSAGGGEPADGERVAGPVRGAGPGRAGRREAVRPEAVDRPASSRGGDVDPATGKPGSHALVVATAGEAAGHQPRHHRRGLEAVRGETVASL